MMCERYSCKMSEMACFIRRRNALSHSPATYNKPGFGDLGCKGCAQGTAIAAKINPDEAEAYSAGLRTVMSNGAVAVMAEKRAAKKRGRPAKQTAPPVKENRGDMIIKPVCPPRDYLMGKANEPVASEVFESELDTPPAVRIKYSKVKPIGPPNVNHSFPSLPTPTDRKQDDHIYIILDMSDYPQLLNGLQVEAKQQFRTLENQILYFLHTLADIRSKEADNAKQD